jgi:DNA repair protein RecN (Recombination protein N)
MLKQICIQNIAIAQNVNVEFDSGLNIITGETGAGKSILIDALGLLRGQKVDISLIRRACDSAQVTAIFMMPDNSGVFDLLAEMGIPLNEDDPSGLIIRRIIHRNSKHRAFINDVPVNAKALNAVAGELIDISSQFENQRLLDPDSHTFYLDIFVNAEEGRKKFLATFLEVWELFKKVTALEKEISLRKREEALYSFELGEIEKAALNELEFQNVQAIVSLGSKAAQAQKICGGLFQFLAEGDGSALALLKMARKQAEKLSKLTKETKALPDLEKYETALADIEDIVQDIERTSEAFQIDEEQLSHASERLDTYNKLLSRFGPSLAHVEEYREKCSIFLNQSSDLEIRAAELCRKAAMEMKSAVTLAHELSKARSAGLERLSTAIEEDLFELGMPKARFVCSLKKQDSLTRTALPLSLSDAVDASMLEEFLDLSKSGFERAEFLMSANPGMEPQALDKVASGGELSRIMLAIKSVLFERDALSVFVFDEIDTGISGNIASKVGRKMAEFCAKRQALCVTHLPQVACYGKSHFIVSKSIHDGLTSSKIRRASDEERVMELAGMLSGETVTTEGMAQAKTLVTQARTARA